MRKKNLTHIENRLGNDEVHRQRVSQKSLKMLKLSQIAPIAGKNLFIFLNEKFWNKAGTAFPDKLLSICFQKKATSLWIWLILKSLFY